MSAVIAAELALTRQAIALSTIKQAADADKKLADTILNSVLNVPTGKIGSSVNITA